MTEPNLTHKLADLQVGDILICHWNYAVTLKRMIRPSEWLNLIHRIPSVILTWFFRKGTGSYWEHVGMVYQLSPKVLVLEARRNSGVTLHALSYYTANRGEWNLQVIRPKHLMFSEPTGQIIFKKTATETLNTPYGLRIGARLALRYLALRTYQAHWCPLVAFMASLALPWLILVSLAKNSRAPIFTCSGLVQYLLIATGKQLGVQEEALLANPGRYSPQSDETLPQDFADSPKFYLVNEIIDGAVPLSTQPAAGLRLQDLLHTTQRHAF